MKCYNWKDIKEQLTWIHLKVMRVDKETHAEVYWDVDEETLDVKDLRPWRVQPADKEEHTKAANVGLEMLKLVDVKQTIESAKWCEYVQEDVHSRHVHLVAPMMSVRMEDGVYDVYLFGTFEKRFDLTVTGEA